MQIAFSDGLDYIHGATATVLFSHQVDQRVCFDITITNDTVLENDEMFRVFLGSTGLRFSPDTATITIIDSNCKNLYALFTPH